MKFDNLVPYDTNWAKDVFGYGAISCPDGTIPDGPISGPMWSHDRDFVDYNPIPQFVPLQYLARATTCRYVAPAGL